MFENVIPFIGSVWHGLEDDFKGHWAIYEPDRAKYSQSGFLLFVKILKIMLVNIIVNFNC